MKIRFGKKEVEISDGVEMEEVLSAVAEEIAVVQEALEEAKSRGSKSDEEVTRLTEELKKLKEQLVEDEQKEDVLTDEQEEKACKRAKSEMNKAIKASFKAGQKNVTLIENGKQVAGRDGTKSAGGVDGAIIPQFHEEIIKRLRDYSPTIGHFYQMPVGNEDFQLPVRNGKTGAKLGRDYGAGAPDIVWNRGSFLAATAKPIIPDDLVNDAFFDVVSFVQESLGEDFATLLGDTLLNGTRAGDADSCDGLLIRFNKVEGAKDQDTRKTDYFKVIDLSAKTMDESFIDELFAVTEDLKSGYRVGAKWFMSTAQFLALNKLKDKMGHSYIKTSVVDGTVYQLHGKDIVVDSTMESASPIIYGDMNRAIAQLNLANSFSSKINPWQVDGSVTVPTAMRHGLIVRDNTAVIGVIAPAAVAGE